MNDQAELRELAAFAVVAEERSFTRAAKKLRTSQSALSHTIRRLESRLDTQLLARTTRSVSTTPAGMALLDRLAPALRQIHEAVSEVRNKSGRPSGRVRLIISRSAAPLVLLPKLAAFHKAYPNVVLDVQIVSGPTDLIQGRFDAGILTGDYIERDMVAVRVTPDHRFAIVGSPSYFAAHPVPSSPRDLTTHQCIGYSGPNGPYRWEFRKASKALNVNVAGPLIIDDAYTAIQAALDGVGLAQAFETQVTDLIEQKRLIRVLEDWCPSFSGFFLYYPSRRNQTAALTAVIKSFRTPPKT